MTIEAHSFARTTDARKRPQKPRKMHMTSVGAYFFFTKGLRAPQFHGHLGCKRDIRKPSPVRSPQRSAALR